MRSNFIAFRAGIDLMVPIDRSLGGNAVGSRSVMQQRGSESVAVLASRPQLRKKAETSHGNASPRGPNIPRCTKSCSRMQRNACCSPPPVRPSSWGDVFKINVTFGVPSVDLRLQRKFSEGFCERQPSSSLSWLSDIILFLIIFLLCPITFHGTCVARSI